MYNVDDYNNQRLNEYLENQDKAEIKNAETIQAIMELLTEEVEGALDDVQINLSTKYPNVQPAIIRALVRQAVREWLV